MTEISDEAVSYRGRSRSEQARSAAPLPHLRGASVDIETRETMREAAEIAWAIYGHTNENLGWFAVVDAVVALIPKATVTEDATDQHLAAIEVWRSSVLRTETVAGIAATYLALANLLTRVAALERGR